MKLFVVGYRGLVAPLQELLGNSWKVLLAGEVVMGHQFTAAVFGQGWVEVFGAGNLAEAGDWLNQVRSHMPKGQQILYL